MKFLCHYLLNNSFLNDALSFKLTKMLYIFSFELLITTKMNIQCPYPSISYKKEK